MRVIYRITTSIHLFDNIRTDIILRCGTYIFLNEISTNENLRYVILWVQLKVEMFVPPLHEMCDIFSQIKEYSFQSPIYKI